ncbi:MAG: hypothetical protein J6Y82_12675, partial [Bacteroidales bacterium]|nr:hypothetical protein [Bacteroidales bacterium]
MKKTLTALLCASNVVAASAATEGALEGQFSVSETQKVLFSQGNLQYQPSTKTWRFAEKQYNYYAWANDNISATYDGWIDLFGWGTGKKPTLTDKDNTKFAAFSDWGANAISNGGNKASQWRTLTKAEWNYLLEKRTNAAQLRGFAMIDGEVPENVEKNVEGLVILPDKWQLPSGLTFTPYDGTSYIEPTANKYTLEQWQQMEANGAVLLPSAHFRSGAKTDMVTSGNYWSASPSGTTSAAYLNWYDMLFPCTDKDSKTGKTVDSKSYRYLGNAVRLVQNIPPKSNNGAMSGKFSVSAAKKVFFSQGNLQYQATTKTWRFAENQWEYVGSANSNISATYDGWIDLFGWGTGKKPTLADASDAKYALYSEWGANAISNGGKKINQWRTLTKIEWNYLIEKRKNAAQLRGMAAVEGTYGLVILPDDWTLPEGLTFNASVS